MNVLHVIFLAGFVILSLDSVISVLARSVYHIKGVYEGKDKPEHESAWFGAEILGGILWITLAYLVYTSWF